jgi:hypothetical protein
LPRRSSSRLLPFVANSASGALGEGLGVTLGVTAGVPLRVLVPVCVAVPVPVGVADSVLLMDAPDERVAVGDALGCAQRPLVAHAEAGAHIVGAKLRAGQKYPTGHGVEFAAPNGQKLPHAQGAAVM